MTGGGRNRGRAGDRRSRCAGFGKLQFAFMALLGSCKRDGDTDAVAFGHSSRQSARSRVPGSAKDSCVGCLVFPPVARLYILYIYVPFCERPLRCMCR